jgi:hypothetical protein
MTAHTKMHMRKKKSIPSHGRKGKSSSRCNHESGRSCASYGCGSSFVGDVVDIGSLTRLRSVAMIVLSQKSVFLQPGPGR